MLPFDGNRFRLENLPNSPEQNRQKQLSRSRMTKIIDVQLYHREFRFMTRYDWRHFTKEYFKINLACKTVKQNRQRRFLYNWQNFDIDKAALGDEMGEASQKRSFEKAVESFGLKKKVESAPQLGAARSSSRLSDVKPRRHSFHAEGDSSKARSSARSSSKNSRARTPTR